MPPSRSGKPKGDYNLGSLVPDGGRVEHDIKIRPRETKAEQDLRLRKDFWSFVVKDLLSYLLAFVTLLVGISYAGYVLFAKSPAEKDEKQWAMTVLSSILGGVVGLIFGKATK